MLTLGRQQFLHKMKYDLRGHGRSHMGILDNNTLIIHLSTYFDKKKNVKCLHFNT